MLSEVAAVGQGWQQIKEPGTSHSLKTMLGAWNDLPIVCGINVGL